MSGSIWIAIVVVLLAEALAFGRFVPWYYRFNIPLYRRALPRSVHSKRLGSVEALIESSRDKGWGGRRMRFKALDGATVAFHPTASFWGWLSPSHVGGTIHLDVATSSLRFRGFVAWWLLALVTAFWVVTLLFLVRGYWEGLRVAFAVAVFMTGVMWFELGHCRRLASLLESELQKSEAHP